MKPSTSGTVKSDQASTNTSAAAPRTAGQHRGQHDAPERGAPSAEQAGRLHGAGRHAGQGAAHEEHDEGEEDAAEHEHGGRHLERSALESEQRLVARS